MNLTWHIIKKDLRHRGLFLLVWAAIGAFALYSVRFPLINAHQKPANPNVGLLVFLAGISSVLWSLLTLALIAMIVQDDDVMEDKVFWRTRPISPGQLLVAKAGLILPVFFVLPYLAWNVAFISPMIGPRGPSFHFTVLPALTAVLMAMALASCTRRVARFFVGLFLCFLAVIFCGWALAFLPHFTPIKIRIPFVVIPIYCSLLAIAVLLNQYLRRRLALSIALIGVAIVGTTLLSRLPMG